MKSSIYLAKREETAKSLRGSKNKENYIQMKFSYSTSEQRSGENLVKKIFIRRHNEFVIALPRRCKVFKVWENEMEIYYIPLLIINRRGNNRSTHSNEFYVLIMNFIKYRYEKK